MVHEDLRGPMLDGLYLREAAPSGGYELWPRLSSHSPPLLVSLLDPVRIAIDPTLFPTLFPTLTLTPT